MCYIFFLITELNRPQQNKTKQNKKQKKLNSQSKTI